MGRWSRRAHCTVWHDLDGGLALLGGLGQVAELPAHHFVAVELQQHPDVAGRRDGVVGLQRRAPQLVSTRVVWALSTDPVVQHASTGLPSVARSQRST